MWIGEWRREGSESVEESEDVGVWKRMRGEEMDTRS